MVLRPKGPSTCSSFGQHCIAFVDRNPRYVLTGLQPYKMYYVRVAAVNAVGQGKFSILNSQTNEVPGSFESNWENPDIGVSLIRNQELYPNPQKRSCRYQGGTTNEYFVDIMLLMS
eukprot:6153417-Amphidinium_carterae.1